MDKRKILALTSGLIYTAFLLVVTVMALPVRGMAREWESFMSFGQVTEMVVYNGDIWTATTGGLVRIDPELMTHQTYTNVDGLHTNQIYALCVDDRNRLWIGGRGRLINFTDPDHPDGYLFTDNDGGQVEIYDIDCSPGGDSLWVANRLGVTIFLAPDEPGQGLILDTYTRLGEIERDTPARRVALDGDSVWVGTDRGLAVGPRADIRLLKTPLSWHSYAVSEMEPTIPTDSIWGLVIKNDTVVVGTVAGLYRFDAAGGPSLTNLGLYNDPRIFDIGRNGDSLLIHSARGSSFLYEGIVRDFPFEGMPIRQSTAGAVDNNGVYWNGNLLYGVYYLRETEMTAYDAGGMPSNDCRKIVEAQGKIWGAFGKSGLAYYENDIWETVAGVEGQVVTIAVGPLDELWIGTWGSGVYRVDSDTVMHFDTLNSALSGLWDAPGYVVVSDINSSGDAIWFSNLLGRNGEVVAVNPYNIEQWAAYVLIGGQYAVWLETITSGQDVVYAGSQNSGIYARSYSGSPFNSADDYTWRFSSDSSGIGSDIIKFMRVDAFDSLWVGTAYGLSYQALGEVFFRNIIVPDSFGPEVTSFDFDGQGSLYAGSARGMVIRDIATGTFEYLTGANSGLVDDAINDIFYQEEANAFWIATAGGLSRMTSAAAVATDNIEEVLTYPNPFIIRHGTELVRFGYTGNAEISIFTLAGEMVREIPVTGVWDGRNEQGEPVASGVYLFTLTDRDGNVGRGKLLLVRE
ncbi:MAG: hypothetical protein GY841_09010 [FCB group bacterium]|nr:hypothetical protein [FCB group bacterium]